MEEHHINRLEHPPYSPDLAPCDFFLFGYMKQRFSDTEFKDEDDAVEKVSEWIASIPKKTLIAVFDNWRKRLRQCIETGGYIVNLKDKDYNEGGTEKKERVERKICSRKGIVKKVQKKS